MIKSYRELLIWKKGIELVKEIYGLVRRFPKEELYGLGNQLRRSSISIPSNIAEGQARQSAREFKQFLFIALGSLAEVDTQLVIAGELGFVVVHDVQRLEEEVTELRKMISGLVRKLTTGH